MRIISKEYQAKCTWYKIIGFDGHAVYWVYIEPEGVTLVTSPLNPEEPITEDKFASVDVFKGKKPQLYRAIVDHDKSDDNITIVTLI